ncbi:hypothetical protein K488DRAFT_78632 [Vararia minispora EC-137]|uniref:Uncharacterized protein n=1 Tax=Vararia minispora EC-137 TaxID=1314806 RepID=A0ACB8QK92_9AGAM|nr:hypothetical protein K488DRAFT_78632 [Vararia minispora EC-137]
MASSKLFEPIAVGRCLLRHRIVMAPMTRNRASDEHVPTDMMIEYYRQRASTPGTLIITEGTIVSPKAGGFPRVPGIWSQEQIKAWKKITDVVHAKGSFIWLQIAGLGRSASPDLLAAQDIPYTGVSAIQHPDHPFPPRELTVLEIKSFIDDFSTAARNAIDAGFDGIEVHGANGFLVDQFLQTTTNTRKDEYGGSVENRIRFVVELIDAIAGAIGEERTALRLSPWNVSQNMGMPDPIPTFETLVKRIDSKYPRLGYIHVTEPDAYGKDIFKVERSNAFVDAVRLPRPVIHAGGFNRETALEATKVEGVLIAFATDFLSNPDLPDRLRKGADLTPADRKTFYGGNEVGYIDYPFAAEAASAVSVPVL